MLAWLHDKALDLVALLMAIVAALSAYLMGQRKQAADQVAEHKDITHRLDVQASEINRINKRLHQGDEELVSNEQCSDRRDNIRMGLIMEVRDSQRQLDKRMDSQEAKLDAMIDNQARVYKGQADLEHNQLNTSMVLRELVDRLSRRSTDDGYRNRGYDDAPDA